MVYSFKLDPEAIETIQAVYDRLSEKSPDRADQWSDGLFKTIETLKTFPIRCPVESDLDHLGVEVRELLYGKRTYLYRILFAIRDDSIVILALRHSSQGPPD